MQQQQTPEATEERQATAREAGRPTMTGIDPAQLVGLLLEVVKSKCDCRPCRALRAMADRMADAALGPDERGSA